MSTPLTLTVETKVLGQRRPATSPWHVGIAPRTENSRPLTLRDLLVSVITREVEAFNERQEQRLILHILKPDDIAAGVVRGKIDMGGHDEAQVASVEDAVAAALQAFADRLYLVFLDGRQVEALDEEVAVHDESHLTFVRLVPLIGG